MTFAPLSSLVDISMGSAPPSTAYNDNGEGVPMIAGAGDFGEDFPRPKKWTRETTRLANKGDLIVCVRATIGDLNWADREYCLGRGVAGFRAKPGKADLRYIARALEAKKDEFSRLGTGSTFLAIRRGEIEDFEIPLPPTLDEQKRIAAVLDKADALRRQRQESLQLTEKLLQSVFIDMFGDPDELPQMALGELLTQPLRNGLSPASGGAHRDTVFTLSAITRGYFNPEARKEAMFAGAPRPAARVSSTDFLICRGNGNLRLCGRGQFPTDDAIGVIFPDTIIAASIDVERVAKAYFETLWNQPFVRRQIESGARTANGIHKVNQTTLEGIKIPLPDFAGQLAFGRVVESIVSSVKDFEASAKHMDNLFLGLQQRAFRGELDLSRLVLEPEDATPPTTGPVKPATKPAQTKAAARFIQAPSAIETALQPLDRTVAKGDPIPWSLDYFKYRILAAQPAPIRFAELMQKAEAVFDEPPPYEQIKDLFYDLLGQDGQLALLRQRFDQREEKELNDKGEEVTNFVKEMVFEPLP